MKVIHCETKEEYIKVLEKFEEMGRTWNGGDKPTDYINWNKYKSTCLVDKENFTCSTLEYYEEKEGYEIITASEYLNELKQGDILVDENGHERKILGICGDVYLMSHIDDFKSFYTGYTKSELDKLEYELKSDKESDDEVEKAIKLLEEKGKIVNGQIIK